MLRHHTISIPNSFWSHQTTLNNYSMLSQSLSASQLLNSTKDYAEFSNHALGITYHDKDTDNPITRETPTQQLDTL